MAQQTSAGTLRGLIERVVSPEKLMVGRYIFQMATPDDVRAPFSPAFKLWAWRRGFEVRHAAIYDRAGVEAGDYLSDYAQVYRCRTLNPIPAVLDNKLLFRQVLADGGFRQPEVLALITRHGVVSDPLGAARPLGAAELEAELVAAGGRFIAKPENGRFGLRVSLVETQGDRLVTRRGRKTFPFNLARDARPVSLIERAIKQHAFWDALCPHSVNTMRIVTMWTPGDAEPFIGRAVQRIGTEETLPTDNWSGGGICALIDLPTGTLSTGRVYRFESAHEDRPYTHHPDSGAPLAGSVLPHWERIKEVVLAAARSLPYARYIGWDIAVGEDGTPVFIEGNHNTGLKTLQAHRGLLIDPAIRRFYEVCGII